MELAILSLLIFFFGASIGSFLNVVVERTARDEGIKGRSYCEDCKKTLQLRDLIPIFSYLSTKGRCRYCTTTLSKQYLLMETITGIVFVTIFLFVTNGIYIRNDYVFNPLHIPFFNNAFPLLYYFIASAALIALFLSDLKYGLLFDKITIPTIIFVLTYKIATSAYFLITKYFELSNDSFGQYLIQAGFLNNRAEFSLSPLLYTIGGSLLIALLFLTLIIATKGRGMGGGDVKLGLLIGLITGWPHMLMAIMLGFLTGSLVSIILILSKQRSVGQTIPFGPFLIIGCLVVMFFGNQLFDFYLVNILGMEAVSVQ